MKSNWQEVNQTLKIAGKTYYVNRSRTYTIPKCKAVSNDQHMIEIETIDSDRLYWYFNFSADIEVTL